MHHSEPQRRYWVPKGRQLVKTVIGGCEVCRTFQGKRYSEPPISSLPAFRVREAPSFSRSGVDFTGTLFVRNKKDGNVVYILLWSCCVLELLH